MKFSGKMSLTIILSHKKPGLHPFSEIHIFRKTTGGGGGGGQIDEPVYLGIKK